jgi:hypothetical protein
VGTLSTDAAGGSSEETLHLRSEFASVEVRVDRSANGDRLWLHCQPADVEVLLDPLQLEAIARLPDPVLKEILNSIQADAVTEADQEETPE